MKTKLVKSVVFVLSVCFALVMSGCCGALPTPRTIVVTATPGPATAVPTASPTPVPTATPIPTPTVPPTPTSVPPTRVPPTVQPTATIVPTPAPTKAPVLVPTSVPPKALPSQKITVAGRASARKFSDGMGYYVNFGILNISDSSIKVNEIHGVFLAGSPNKGLTIRGKKLGSVSWEIKPGEKVEHYFDTAGYTDQLFRDAGGGKIVLEVSLYLDDKFVPGTGPFYAELPPLGTLRVDEGVNLVFGTEMPKTWKTNPVALFPLP